MNVLSARPLPDDRGRAARPRSRAASGRPPGPIDAAVQRAVELVPRRAAEEEPPVDLDDDPGRGARDSRRARRSCSCSRSSARRPSRCCESIRGRAGGDETLAAGGVDQARAERIREIVRIVQEIGRRRDHDRGVRDAGHASAARAEQLDAAARRSPCARLDEPKASRRRSRRATTASSGSRRRWSASSTARPSRARRRSSRRATRSPPGQTLCILEAMKLMNEIKAEQRGHRPRDPRRQRGARRVRPAAVRARAGRRRRSTRSGMFRRVLVANRGEIAVRVIRALHELGVEAVADLLDRRRATRCTCGSPTTRSASARRRRARATCASRRVVAAATTTGCEAVHPGYGFLAENPAFVEACVDNDLVFVGPGADVMARMGDKIRPRRR